MRYVLTAISEDGTTLISSIFPNKEERDRQVEATMTAGYSVSVLEIEDPVTDSDIVTAHTTAVESLFGMMHEMSAGLSALEMWANGADIDGENGNGAGMAGV